MMGSLKIVIARKECRQREIVKQRMGTSIEAVRV
jgi:hypothetical protein